MYKKIFSNRKILGYIATFIPALIGLIQLFLLYKASSSEANSYFSAISLPLMLSGILAFNTGYVFILRANELTTSEAISEYFGIVLLRLMTFVLIIVPSILIFIKYQKSALILFSFLKLVIEIYSVFNRAIDRIDKVFKIVILSFLFDLIATLLCYYYKGYYIYIYTLSSLVTIFFIIDIKICRDFFIHKFDNLKIKEYLTKILPLSLSSIRENLTGPGLIFLSSEILTGGDLSLLINGNKIYSTGTILIGVYSNFYVQDLIRKGRNLKDEYILFLLMISGYTVLQIFLSYTGAFSNIGNLIPIHFILFFIIGVMLQAQYFVYQNLLLKKAENNKLYFFETIYIITFFIIMLTKKVNFLFIINFICISTAFILLNLKNKFYGYFQSRNS